VLEDGIIDRIGSERPIPVNAQVIAATNKNLEHEITEGNFREDLYYRLNVITIEVPPLRQRQEDIPLLVDFFLKNLCAEKRLEPKKISKGAMTLFLEHGWQGNIRQLRNVIERLVVLSESNTISAAETAHALKKNIVQSDNAVSRTLIEAREQFERDFILKSLVASDWKILETAAALGIDRSHLWKKMKRYGIERRE
jgi:two-component system nitrogen regulation response regulator NtrX